MDKEYKHFSGGRRYNNDEITVYWKPSACIHATYCFKELIEVFDPGRRPWVDMSGATTEKIIDVVNLCPTEALTWKWNDEEKNLQVGEDQLNHIKFKRPELINTNETYPEGDSLSVKVLADGPIILKGHFTLIHDGNQKEYQQSMISICRCGASNRQPFCDGQHRKIGFHD